TAEGLQDRLDLWAVRGVVTRVKHWGQPTSAPRLSQSPNVNGLRIERDRHRVLRSRPSRLPWDSPAPNSNATAARSMAAAPWADLLMTRGRAGQSRCPALWSWARGSVSVLLIDGSSY